MPPPSNIAASVQARLKKEARARSENLQVLLEEFALGRFFARLSVSDYQDRLILKGAQLFRLWSEQAHRPTRDADFLGFGDPDPPSLARVFDQIGATAVKDDDGLKYEAAKAEAIREGNAYGGIRLRLTATLGRVRVPLQFDVGFGDAITPQSEQRAWPGMLGYPDALLTTYPFETVIAEKLEAIVSLGLANSRMKDFYDLHWLATRFDLDQSSIHAAIHNTFDRRKTTLPTSPPVAYTPEFFQDAQKASQWTGFLRKNRLNAPSLSQVVETIRTRFPLPL